MVGGEEGGEVASADGVGWGGAEGEDCGGGEWGAGVIGLRRRSLWRKCCCIRRSWRWAASW